MHLCPWICLLLEREELVLRELRCNLSVEHQLGDGQEMDGIQRVKKPSFVPMSRMLQKSGQVIKARESDLAHCATAAVSLLITLSLKADAVHNINLFCKIIQGNELFKINTCKRARGKHRGGAGRNYECASQAAELHALLKTAQQSQAGSSEVCAISGGSLGFLWSAGHSYTENISGLQLQHNSFVCPNKCII